MNINSFRELHTQSTAAHFLQHALGSGHISHAYLFSGEKGSGKRDLAELFAKTILCGNRTEGEDTEATEAETHQQMAGIGEMDSVAQMDEIIPDVKEGDKEYGTLSNPMSLEDAREEEEEEDREDEDGADM